MSTFRITAPDGRVLRITGDAMPTEQELDEIFLKTGTNQSVMDNRDGKVYNVPVAMDGIDTQFAIDTQHKGADKGSFFGKIAAFLPLAGEGAKQLVKDDFANARSFARGVTSHIGALSDTAIEAGYHYQDKVTMLQEAERGDFSRWGNDLSEEQKKEILEERRLKVQWVKDLRQKNRQFWENTSDALIDDERMTDMNRLFAGVAEGAMSVTEQVGLTMATKNPLAAAGIMAGVYGKMRNTEYFDKAIEAGMDAEEASSKALVAGSIESGLELVGDAVLAKVGKFKAIRDISTRVLSNAAIKAAQRKIGQAALKKMGTRHTDSVFGAALKGFASEGLEEGSQSAVGMFYENMTGVSDYSVDEVLSETLFSSIVGGLTGGLTGAGGTGLHNQQIRNINNRIKSTLKEQTPELTEEESQVMADAVQEMLFQESGNYTKEMNKIVKKEMQPDVLPEGLTADKLLTETRKLLSEKYGMSEEDIDKTVAASLAIVDGRNQFNEAYTTFYDMWINNGGNAGGADASARLLAARALTIAREEKGNIKDVLRRWDLQFKREMSGKQEHQPADMASLDENVNKPLFQLSAEAYNKQGKADVNSEAFKRWFGDSKVVDESGQPLKMVHFSGNEFSQFDKNRTGINNDESAVGFWFADKDDFAFNNEYHPVRYDVYLKMDNPLIIEGKGTETNPWADTDIDNLDPYTKFEKMFNDLMYQDPQMWDERVSESLYGGFETQKIKLHFANLSEERKREVIKSIVDKLKTQGYDGIIIKNTQFDSVNPDEKINQYVVFEPNQIKSVYNRGTFDPNNDNIYYQGQIADNGRGVELTINSQEEMQGLSDEDFKNKMLDTLKSFKGNKIFNQSLNGDIEIRTSSIKKYKSFFADKNKRLIVPYIPELLGKARFVVTEQPYNKRETSIKAYYKADLPINIDEDNYNVHLTVREDQYGNFFWDAQVKENLQKTTPATNPGGLEVNTPRTDPATNPGDKGLTSELSEDTLSITPAKANVNKPLYQDNEATRGAYAREGESSIIYLFENADPSTIVHELGHFFLDDLQRFGKSEKAAEQLRAIYDYVGSANGILTKEQHEKFADSFEVYLLEGRSPNQTLAKVFARFKRWLWALWEEVQRIRYVRLTDEMRKTFGDLLGGRSLDFTLQMSSLKMAESLQGDRIPANVVQKTIDMLQEGKISRSELDELIEKMNRGELKRKDFAAALKPFEASSNVHHERLNPFDTVKYRSILNRGQFKKSDVTERISRLLKWTEPRTSGGKLVGRFPNKKLNDYFDHIRELMAMSKEQARDKIDENTKIINDFIQNGRGESIDNLVFDNKVLSIPAQRTSAKILVDVYNAISESYNLGRVISDATLEAKRRRKAQMIAEAEDVLTDGGRVNWRKQRGKLRQAISKLGASQMSWNGLMDILSMNDKKSKTGESLLSRNLDVFEAEQAEARGVAEDGEAVSKLIGDKIAGAAQNKGISVSRYVNSELQKEYVIEWHNNRRKFTKDELIDIYMKAKDPETRKIMVEDRILAFDEAFLSEVNQNLTAEDRAVADALFEFYDRNHAKMNDFYEEKYGVSLPKSPFYSPRSIETSGVDVQTGDLSSYAGFSGVKKRTAKAGTVKIRGAFAVLQDYIVNSNHWLAWADKLIDINGVMGDVKIKNIIRNLFGEKMNARINYEISRMASNDKFQGKFGFGNLFNKIRSNYAISVLAVKPALAIKQLTSFPAYWEHMTTAEFMSGLADFARHPRECMEMLGNTTLMKSRDVNIIKDFAELSKTEMFKKNTTKIKLRELMMLNIKLGDRGAIYLGGWALYKAELKKNLAAGMSEEQAKAKALEKFERVTDETQQSGRLSQQSYWQSNPFLRAFTMFQSSQNQYLRKELNAVRGLATGRMGWEQAVKTIFIFHVLLPCFFQFASDGFEWDKKAQLRAALLGSLNGIFLLNGILEKGLDIAMGETNAWSATRTGLRDVIPFWGSGEDLAKFFISLAEGDVDLEDYMEVVKAFGKPAGELTGIPVKYPLDVIQNLGSYAEDGEYKKEVLLWLGWSPYALRDRDDE